MGAMKELDGELRGLYEPKRVACTIRMDRAQYDALQASYYARINEHRLSFNAWIVEVIAAGASAPNHRLSMEGSK